MRKYRSERAVFFTLTVALLAAVIAGSLPDNPYLRFQLLNDTIQSKATWVFERIHFDPAPIDIAFVGPSRMMAAVDATILAERLTTSRNVVNFALPENGRNLHYVIAKELFSIKRPRMIVVGVIERPSRFGHPAFRYVAQRGDVLNAPKCVNPRYLPDLSFIPFRQLKLAVASVLPSYFGMRTDFDINAYEGSNPIPKRSVSLPSGIIVDLDKTPGREILDAQVVKYRRGVSSDFLPGYLREYEYVDERSYIREIEKIASMNNAKVAFLFIPYFSGPVDLEHREFYESIGPVFDASFVGDAPDLFSDYGHLNSRGARLLTDWLATELNAIAW